MYRERNHVGVGQDDLFMPLAVCFWSSNKISSLDGREQLIYFKKGTLNFDEFKDQEKKLVRMNILTHVIRVKYASAFLPFAEIGLWANGVVR